VASRLRPTEGKETTAVDVQCSHCGREPSHPQVRHRFTYAAYYRSEAMYSATPRCYVAALCEPCYDADLRAQVGTARNRFLSRIRRWSGTPINQSRIVRLLEHPEGVIAEEREADNCFQNGVSCSYNSLIAAQQEES